MRSFEQVWKNGGIAVGIGNQLVQPGLEAGIVGQMAAQFAALFHDAQAPAFPAQGRLELPFQQMQQQRFQPIDQFTLFAAPHALDLLGDMVDIGSRQPAGAQQSRLLIGPGVESCS